MKTLLIFLLACTFGISLVNAKALVVENKLSVDNTSLTIKHSDIIFKQTKVFPNNTQVSIALINDGVISYYGIKRVNDKIVTSHNHHNVFEIGSISKVFTATMLANLVGDKKLKLDDGINDFINLPLNKNAKITFKQLATHHSGLPSLPSNFIATDMLNPYKDYDKHALEHYLINQLKLGKKKYAYSNLGAGILGYALGEVEGKTFQQLLDKYITNKFSMPNTTTVRKDVEKLSIKGVDFEGNEASNWDFDSLVAAGGILSNVEDLAQFALAQFDKSNTELALTRNKTFEINSNMDIGLGWHILNKHGKVFYWHNGGTGGYTSSMTIDTANKNAVIILSNVSAFNNNMGNIDKLNFALMKLF